MEDVRYVIIALSRLLERNDRGAVSERLSSFRPYKDDSTAEFLTEHAIDMELNNLSRTYLAVSDDGVILGFVSVGIKCLKTGNLEGISDEIIGRINPDPRTGIIQAYLLGQLARSKDAPKGMGRELLDYAMAIFRRAKTLIGCDIVRLDCVDQMEPYYEKLKFRHFKKNKDNDLNQMLTFID